MNQVNDNPIQNVIDEIGRVPGVANCSWEKGKKLLITAHEGTDLELLAYDILNETEFSIDGAILYHLGTKKLYVGHKQPGSQIENFVEMSSQDVKLIHGGTDISTTQLSMEIKTGILSALEAIPKTSKLK